MKPSPSQAPNLGKNGARRAAHESSTPTAADAPCNTPAALLPYQQLWVDDASPLKVIEKSRRTGLTWAEAADNVLTAAAAASAGGQNVYYIAYNQDMTVEYVQACAMWARAFHHAASAVQEGFWDEGEDERHIKTFTIRFPASGHRIVALSSRPSNLRGRQGTIVIDEAAFHDQLDELLKAALAMLIWGGRVHVISTHNGVDNAFFELIEDIRAGRRRGSVHRITFDEAVEQGLFERVCLRAGRPWSAAAQAAWVAEVRAFYGEGATEELDCIPAASGGAWLSRALIEQRMSAASPVLRYACPAGFELLSDERRAQHCRDWMQTHLAPRLAALPRHALSFVGEDFGRSGDLSVFVPLIQQQNLTLQCPFMVELRNVPFRQQEQLAFYLMDGLPRLMGAAFDARGNGQFLAEVCAQRYGASRVQGVMLSEAWYREHMPPLKAALEDGTLVDLPRDADILADLRSIEVIAGVPRVAARRTGADRGQRHGDAAIALALAHFASREIQRGPVRVKSRQRRKTPALLAHYPRSFPPR